MNVVKLGNDLAPKIETAPVPNANPAGYSSQAYVDKLREGDMGVELPKSATRVFWAAVDFRHAMDIAEMTGKEDDFIHAKRAWGLLMVLCPATKDDVIEKLTAFERRFGVKDNWTDETLNPQDLAYLQMLVREAGDFI